MKRLIAAVLGLSVVVLVVLAPALFWNTGDASTTDSDFTISSYRATMDISTEGDLTVDEVLGVSRGSGAPATEAVGAVAEAAE